MRLVLQTFDTRRREGDLVLADVVLEDAVDDERVGSRPLLELGSGGGLGDDRTADTAVLNGAGDEVAGGGMLLDPGEMPFTMPAPNSTRGTRWSY